MKKLFMWCAAAALVMMSACSSDASKKAETEAETTEEVVETETPAQEEASTAVDNANAVDPYIQNLMAKDPEVKTTPSGLAYKVITPGVGENPKANSNVSVKYVGKHIDGSEFDNSQGSAIQFNLQEVIPGFTEGLMLMNKGAKYELYIPGNLAYGSRGVPQAGIQPNELLVFEIELVDFN